MQLLSMVGRVHRMGVLQLTFHIFSVGCVCEFNTIRSVRFTHTHGAP
jgi:hypothetical protein